MLWSLIKVLVFVAIIAALAMGASYLMETDGGVQITVAGTEVFDGSLTDKATTKSPAVEPSRLTVPVSVPTLVPSNS